MKAFREWNFCDFDFAHAESLADQPIRKGHASFNGLVKSTGFHQQSKNYPVSNLADVL